MHHGCEQFTPYVTVGVGLMNADAEAEGAGLIEDDTTVRFAWNWGGDRFGLRADVRCFSADELAGSVAPVRRRRHSAHRRRAEEWASASDTHAHRSGQHQQ
jgi:hypothetical protein